MRFLRAVCYFQCFSEWHIHCKLIIARNVVPKDRWLHPPMPWHSQLVKPHPLGWSFHCQPHIALMHHWRERCQRAGQRTPCEGKSYSCWPLLQSQRTSACSRQGNGYQSECVCVGSKCWYSLASSPGHSHIFNVTRRNVGVAWGWG